MDAIIDKYEQSLQQLKQNVESLNADAVKKSADDNIKILQNSILELSKFCLNTLSDCNSELISMSNSISSVEDEVQIIRDSKSKQLQPKAQPPKQGVICSSLLVESRSPNPVIVPDSPFTVNFDCLNDIGGSGENIQENTVLVRKVQPNTDEPQLWTRQKDYFTTKAQGKSTFNDIYNTTT